MVSVFEGQLTRTWFYELDNKKHVLNLYHDTISGVRSAMLDYQEIRGSLGNSSIMMDSKGHRIFFQVGNHPGYIEIKNSWFSGFEYNCVINDKVIKEVTQGVPENQDLIFKPKVLDTTFTADENSEYPVAWYVLQTTRITDNVTTTVHRRFREFVELNSQIKQNMKGHHLRDVLPQMPDKPSKQFTDHRDPAFIQDRCFKLERFVVAMTSIPHVANMVCMKAFLGIMDQVREYSLTFHVPTLGMSLLPTERQGETGVTPCVVGMIQKPEVCKGVLPGDSVSRVNGVPLAGSTFNAAIARIKTLPRPLIIHFIQVIVANKSNLAVDQERIEIIGLKPSGASHKGANSQHDHGPLHNDCSGRHVPSPGHVLDEVSEALAEEEERLSGTHLFQGDNEPEEEAGVWQEEVPLDTEPEAAEEEFLPEAILLSEPHVPVVVVPPKPAATVAPSVLDTVPVEFVDVDIVQDKPARAVPSKASPAAVASSTAGTGSAVPPAGSASKVAAKAPTSSNSTSAAAPVKVAAAAGVSVAPKPVAAKAAPAPVAASTTVPVTTTTASSTPATTAAVATPGGVKARIAAMNKDSSPQQATQTASPAIKVTTVPAATPIQSAVNKPTEFSPAPVPKVAVPIVKNRSIFEDVPESASNKGASSSAPAPSSAGSAKNPLFKDEVVGFGVVPPAAPAAPAPKVVAPVVAKAAVAPAAAPVAAKPVPAPVPATSAPVPTESGLKTPFSGGPKATASASIPVTTSAAGPAPQTQAKKTGSTSFGKVNTVKAAEPAPANNALLGWD